tara:strand:- start:5242 stop:6303 length:1062 start_codon:yes stop_codon:yes gene_type:complete
MRIKTFISIVSKLPAHIGAMAKGPTGIGKSDVFKQLGKHFNLKVIDKRLAFLTEGDLLGLPIVDGKTTRFLPPDWFVECCENGRILFLDEINRATREVQNCAFQIVLDREINGYHLHPETRVYVAVNVGNEYQVLDMDPALERRFYSRTLDPTTDDWLDWAKNIKKTIDPLILEYIERYPSHLRYTGKFLPNKKFPNPAAWEMLNDSLIYAKMSPSIAFGPNYNHEILEFAEGFIGEEYAIKFSSFVKDYVGDYSVQELIAQYPSNSSMFNTLPNAKKNNIINKIIDYSDMHSMILSDVSVCCDFVGQCSQEMIVNFLDSIMLMKNTSNMRSFHNKLKNHVLKHLNEIVLDGH